MGVFESLGVRGTLPAQQQSIKGESLDASRSRYVSQVGETTFIDKQTVTANYWVDQYGKTHVGIPSTPQERIQRVGVGSTSEATQETPVTYTVPKSPISTIATTPITPNPTSYPTNPAIANVEAHGNLTFSEINPPNQFMVDLKNRMIEQEITSRTTRTATTKSDMEKLAAFREGMGFNESTGEGQFKGIIFDTITSPYAFSAQTKEIFHKQGSSFNPFGLEYNATFPGINEAKTTPIVYSFKPVTTQAQARAFGKFVLTAPIIGITAPILQANQFNKEGRYEQALGLGAGLILTWEAPKFAFKGAVAVKDSYMKYYAEKTAEKNFYKNMAELGSDDPLLKVDRGTAPLRITEKNPSSIRQPANWLEGPSKAEKVVDRELIGRPELPQSVSVLSWTKTRNSGTVPFDYFKMRDSILNERFQNIAKTVNEFRYESKAATLGTERPTIQPQILSQKIPKMEYPFTSPLPRNILVELSRQRLPEFNAPSGTAQERISQNEKIGVFNKVEGYDLGKPIKPMKKIRLGKQSKLPSEFELSFWKPPKEGVGTFNMGLGPQQARYIYEQIQKARDVIKFRKESFGYNVQPSRKYAPYQDEDIRFSTGIEEDTARSRMQGYGVGYPDTRSFKPIPISLTKTKQITSQGIQPAQSANSGNANLLKNISSENVSSLLKQASFLRVDMKLAQKQGTKQLFTPLRVTLPKARMKTETTLNPPEYIEKIDVKPPKLPTPFQLSKPGLRREKKPSLASKKKRKKASKKSFFEYVPLADLYSKTITEARIQRPAMNVPITRKYQLKFERVVKTGGQRFPTFEMTKRRRFK